MTFEPKRLLVGVARDLGRSVMHVQRSVKSVRRKAKRTHYVERTGGCERVFEPHRTHEGMVVPQDGHALYLLR